MRTLPSSTVLTFSRSPIVRTSSDVPRNWKEDVREVTRTPRSRVKALMSSSARPSQK